MKFPAPGSSVQKTQTRKVPNFTERARTPFRSFCAGRRRNGSGQITDHRRNTYIKKSRVPPVPVQGVFMCLFLSRCLCRRLALLSVEDTNTLTPHQPPPTTATDDTTTTTTREKKTVSYLAACVAPGPRPAHEACGCGCGRWASMAGLLLCCCGARRKSRGGGPATRTSRWTVAICTVLAGRGGAVQFWLLVRGA